MSTTDSSVPAYLLADTKQLDAAGGKFKPPRKAAAGTNIRASNPRISKTSTKSTIDDPQSIEIRPSAKTVDIELSRAPGKRNNRNEVKELQNDMADLLSRIGLNSPAENNRYPTEMHLFLEIIQNEKEIYDKVFQEIIHQVTLNMNERGLILDEVRQRYSAMFIKIPRHIQGLHTELVAQRRLNKRMSEELVRSRESVNQMWKELEFIRQHGKSLTDQAKNATNNLTNVLARSENSDEAMQDYHKLYTLQRERLEQSIRLSEQEKNMWIEAASSLSLKIGGDAGNLQVVSLQKDEETRVRMTTHIIFNVCQDTQTDLKALELDISAWKKNIIGLSQDILIADFNSLERIGKMQREMEMMVDNLTANSPMDQAAADHPALRGFYIYDLISVIEYVSKWYDEISSLLLRFTSKDFDDIDEISSIRNSTVAWVDKTNKFLIKCEKTTNGKDYASMSAPLVNITVIIEDWTKKLELRNFGDDGSAAKLIAIQGLIDDRLTSLNRKHREVPLPEHDRQSIKEEIQGWVELIKVLFRELSKTVEPDIQRVPSRIDHWIDRLLSQTSSDNNARIEGSHLFTLDNNKLHTSMISWIVQAMVREVNGKKSDTSEADFQVLISDLRAFNYNLLRDATDTDLISDDGKNLADELPALCRKWISTANSFVTVNTTIPRPLAPNKTKKV